MFSTDEFVDLAKALIHMVEEALPCIQRGATGRAALVEEVATYLSVTLDYMGGRKASTAPRRAHPRLPIKSGKSPSQASLSPLPPSAKTVSGSVPVPLRVATSNSRGPSTPNLLGMSVPQEGSMVWLSIVDLHEILESNECDRFVNDDGDKVINDYTVIGPLGRGAMGKVKLVVHNTTEETRALKIMNKSLLMRVMKGDGMTALSQAQQEVAIMKKLRHKNIVRMYEVIDDPQKDKMYIVMQYVQGGPIFEVDKTNGTCPVMPVKQIRCVMRQMCAGLMYLHKHGIVHRDIKPDNVLVDRPTDTVYLADFGVSEICSGDRKDGLKITSTRLEGTPMYMAPEMWLLSGEGDTALLPDATLCDTNSVVTDAPHTLDGERLDVWAWGVTLYCMMYGKHPFFGRSIAEIRKLVPQGVAVSAQPPTADARRHRSLWDALVKLVTRMLHTDPTRRASMTEVYNVLGKLKREIGEFDCALEFSFLRDDDDSVRKVSVAELQESVVVIRSSVGRQSGDVPALASSGSTACVARSLPIQCSDSAQIKTDKAPSLQPPALLPYCARFDLTDVAVDDCGDHRRLGVDHRIDSFHAESDPLCQQTAEGATEPTTPSTRSTSICSTVAFHDRSGSATPKSADLNAEVLLPTPPREARPMFLPLAKRFASV